jgi:hypothetical protein
MKVRNDQMLWLAVCLWSSSVTVGLSQPDHRVSADDVRGTKVLLSVSHSLKQETVGNQLPRDIAQALQRVNVKVLRVLDVTTCYLCGVKTNYAEQLVLLDCQGGDPVTVLKDIPNRGAAMVFQDGNFKQGLPNPRMNEFRKPETVKLPSDHILVCWGSMEHTRMDADLPRYRAMPELAVEFRKPPPASGGSAGSAKLFPKPGHTLLEIYLLTGAGLPVD